MAERPERPDHPDSLQPILQQVEEELSAQLDEVCDRKEVRAESTGELIKLEEALSVAAEAAKETISLRRRIRQKGDVRATPNLFDRGAKGTDTSSPGKSV